ncbi:unnamed protein product [Oppiella nova]|uniref:Suppressor of cytokine signaling 7 n=1 Tax=Oppiella nova TaxID=334625 RepID=A0A7R9LF69_9ACAR|nr:unnamed protein product [Oppiella nova]CAG2162343.1 unnamed protein product [Oppiella nova]
MVTSVDNCSKFVVYLCLLVFSMLFALRLDETIVISYWVVFCPLWLWKCLVIVGALIGTVVWVRNPDYRQSDSSYIHFKSMLISVSLQLLLLMFELLVCDKLESGRHFWILAFIPLVFISLLSIAVCIWALKNDRTFEMELFCSVNILQFIFIALRMDKFITWSWVLVLVPLWILLCLAIIGVLYALIFAAILLRTPEVAAEQRRQSLHSAVSYSLIVLPLLVFLVLLSNKLDSVHTSSPSQMDYFSTCIPLYFTFAILLCLSFGNKGGNLWWFGMRKDFCSFLLSMCPCLRVYGNISYNLHFNHSLSSTPHPNDGSQDVSNITHSKHVITRQPKKFIIPHTIGLRSDSDSDVRHRRERSDKCSVLYAEMPHDLGRNHIPVHNACTESTDRHTNGSTQSGGDGQPLVGEPNYHCVCYNCCSPLSVDELDHNLYYISNDKSKTPTDGHTDGRNDDNSRESSPIMWTICSQNGRHNGADNGCSPVNGHQLVSNYTTVIKPKALRPQLPVTGHSQSHTNGLPLTRPTLPMLSFHGSTHVLTDKDESAFTQISRRRSNSEATHHYQSISNDRQIPSRSGVDYNRPLRHQRSKSVNKAFNNNMDMSLGFSKCQAISDKHLPQHQSKNTNPFYLNQNYSQNSNNSDESLDPHETCSSMYSSEPIHMTLEEVRNIFSKSQSKPLKNPFLVTKHKRTTNAMEDKMGFNKSKSKSKIKCAIESLFRSKRKSCSSITSTDDNSIESEFTDKNGSQESGEGFANNCSNDSPFTHRALPPLPPPINTNNTNESIDVLSREDEERQKFLDYAASIERVKDCGWYWGPISGEMAEKLLQSEPCGSFIVRDSSDEHYIFSLTFKLNGLVRHVRIEHDQGNFSFGSLQKFKSNTIVDFIENAVQHSRSGRFLFFLHRRPVMGPMRVQLLHPVSRFKQIQSLQHMCRFVILKHVRRDLIDDLPLPKMLKCYLNTPYYYSEELALMSEQQSNTNPNPEHEPTLPPNTSQSET